MVIQISLLRTHSQFNLNQKIFWQIQYQRLLQCAIQLDHLLTQLPYISPLISAKIQRVK